MEKHYTGLRLPENFMVMSDGLKIPFEVLSPSIPTEVDWRERGAVTKPKA